MKKIAPYLLAALVAVGLVALFVTGNKQDKRKLEGRITLQKKDKIPYGTFVAYNNLKNIFPAASVYTSRHQPGNWDSLSKYDANQAYVVITDNFSADKEELELLTRFAEKGNDVFVSARYFSAAADAVFGCSSSAYDLNYLPDETEVDSVKLSLGNPPFTGKNNYSYPGRSLFSYFEKIDTTTTHILGYDEKGHPNFIQLRAGKGNFYLHMEPLAFCNYFLLHKNNISYYEKALSVISPAVKKIVWDEYYLRKTEKVQKPKGWLKVLLGYPAFKAALLTALLSLLLYVVLEMRRRQRYIPFMAKPKNESLDFVKTIGRLYFDKGDHKNLCRKMAAYFLEHVRNKYKLHTGVLDDEFINNLKYKSGVEETVIKNIIQFIQLVDQSPQINSVQLTGFHKMLDSFYKKA